MTNATVGGEASAERPKQRSWLAGCALVLITAPLLLIALFLTCGLVAPRYIVGEVERDVEEHLPPGSSEAEVRQYLRERDIEFSEPYPAGQSCCFLQREGIESCCVINAIVRDTGYWFEPWGMDVELYFIFDEHGRLEQFLADEVYTSL